MTPATTTGFWQGKRIFLTGHTGFKGSWLSLWLATLGARVHGFSLAPPTDPSLFEVAGVRDVLASHTLGDIRASDALQRAMREANPDIVLHLAAQPLVRRSYIDPVETYATNVMGAVHLFEAVRACDDVAAVVNVTTDKCYENREWAWGYREDEPMGGHDPYSNSKGCAELVTSAYRQSFLASRGVALGSARAGNVIGGGDWAADRLVPDALRAIGAGRELVVRFPNSTRPWQHVLEPLSGYLRLAERLAGPNGASFASGWNFGPVDDDARSVRWILDHLGNRTADLRWRHDGEEHPHEAGFLKLDSSRARQRLDWQPRWRLATALDATLEWDTAWRAGQPMRQVCLAQISRYAETTAPA